MVWPPTSHQDIQDEISALRALTYNPSKAALDANANLAITTARDAFLSMTTDTRIDTGFSLNRMSDVVIHLPPGRWTVTEVGAFLAGAIPGDGRRHRGLVIQGSGKYSTEIVYSPATAGPLFDNLDRVSNITMRDIVFTGGSTNASFMNSYSAGGPQGFRFENVVWRGTWNRGFHLTGSDVNSEFNFYGCTVLGTWTDFMYNENNVQVLNHNYFGCDMEPDAGNVLNYVVGGNINVYGGSWIGAKNMGAGAGTFVKLGSSTASSINRFLMSGVRIEYRNSSYKLIDSQWSTGNITFTDVHDTGYQGNLANEGTFTRAVFTNATTSAGQFPHIVFEHCRLNGKHQYDSIAQIDQARQDIVYRNCTIQTQARMHDFIVTTLGAGVAGRLSAVAPVRFEGSRSGSNTSSTLVFDGTVNGHITKNTPLTKHSVSIRNGFGSLPGTGEGPFTLTVPLYAVITSVRLVARAGSSAGATTTWSYTLQTTETTPTVLFTKGGADTGGTQAVAINLETTPWFICDSDTKRALTFAAGANTSTHNTGAYFLVEYLA
jgi:hypothetical protein